jgi:hypothetical protein
MNQAILLNDDIHYDAIKKAWYLTGQVNGEIVTVIIAERYLPATSIITSSLIFDIEDQVEQWLTINDADNNQEILLELDC